MATRTQIQVLGIVQGVGFRPYVYSLARRRALNGRVFNNTAGVVIEVEGEEHAIEEFVHEIRLHPPPLSQIEAVERRDNLALADYRDFRIVESTSDGTKFTPISADITTCRDCLRELFDPTDRRFRYPFINCINCGPRFTIIEGIPYDRAETTMRDFEMCSACRSEYENPGDRRFHAEPIACPVCGPRLMLTDASGRESCEADLVGSVRRLLLDGAIIAIKGLGGFHLACNALDTEAVRRLRSRKHREEKPFALMAVSADVVGRICHLSPGEEQLLRSDRRPIVLLERRASSPIPTAVAPGVRTLGFMLPYTPLHHLLMEGLDRPLVMTSANVSDEPICYRDDDAVTRLKEIADYYLMNNRRIFMRADDTVARMQMGKPSILRRSRGYAPAPISTTFTFNRQILACGAELKNTFCLARGQHVFISHHIGDLENVETMRSFTEGIEHFKKLFGLRPEIVAYDLHPEYLSTKYALSRGHDDESPLLIGIQHHHAHIASCLADNGVEGEVIGVAMDGLGFGTDGKLWGGEFFVADFRSAERIAHLDYIPMPGGAKVIREPWRMAAVYLHRVLGDDFLNLPLTFAQHLDRRAWMTLRRMIDARINSPETSSMGRLFDAVAGLLGLRYSITYEGQAAIKLESVADRSVKDAYQFEIAESGVIKADPVIQCAVEDMLDGRPNGEISAKFHLGVADLILRVAHRARDDRRLNRVALSGGVFQNAFLLECACRMLAADGFEVLTHGRVPTNDGGISLGQAAVANAQIQ